MGRVKRNSDRFGACTLGCAVNCGCGKVDIKQTQTAVPKRYVVFHATKTIVLKVALHEHYQNYLT